MEEGTGCTGPVKRERKGDPGRVMGETNNWEKPRQLTACSARSGEEGMTKRRRRSHRGVRGDELPGERPTCGGERETRKRVRQAG